MSKVICSICGTSYPDTATQCPICGCVRPAETAVIPEKTESPGGYTYVKGGRFSKANVRKRNQAMAATTVRSAAEPKKNVYQEPEKKPVDTRRIGLIAVLILLILIVTAMAIYIVRLYQDEDASAPKHGTTQQNANVPCTGLSLSKDVYKMTRSGEMLILDVKVFPENCTDTLSYGEDSEGKVVTVDKSGKVICRGNGTAVVTVKCGEFQKECRITVEIDESLTPTEPEVTEPVTSAPVTIMLNYTVESPLLLTFEAQMATLYAGGEVPVTELEWVSENPRIATVDNNSRVYAMTQGETLVHAKYDGVVVASCLVKCEFKDLEVDNTQEGGDTINMDDYYFGSIFGPLTEQNGFYNTSLKIGNQVKFGLIHKTDSSKHIYFEWTRTNPDDVDQSVVVLSDKMTIERVGTHVDQYCVFQAVYEGKTYKLYVGEYV